MLNDTKCFPLIVDVVLLLWVVVLLMSVLVLKCCRTLKGQEVDCSQYDALVELAMICCLCNDSSLHYNEVQLTIFQCADSVVW